jgi:hypothetical protein
MAGGSSGQFDLRRIHVHARGAQSQRVSHVERRQPVTAAHVQIAPTGVKGHVPQSSQIFPVEFRWQAMKPPLADYVVFLQLLAVDGQLAAQHDGLPQGGYLPTSHWPVDETIVDRHRLALPPVLSAGDYRLIAGLYDPRDGSRLATSTGADYLDLGIVTVTE